MTTNRTMSRRLERAEGRLDRRDERIRTFADLMRWADQPDEAWPPIHPVFSGQLAAVLAEDIDGDMATEESSHGDAIAFGTEAAYGPA